MASAIFYASSTGNTEIIAKQIAKTLSINNIYDISNINIEKINEYDQLIFGASTGEMAIYKMIGMIFGMSFVNLILQEKPLLFLA